jgi:hypothetical protein
MRRRLSFMGAVSTMGVVLAAYALPAIANHPDKMASNTPPGSPRTLTLSDPNKTIWITPSPLSVILAFTPCPFTTWTSTT